MRRLGNLLAVQASFKSHRDGKFYFASWKSQEGFRSGHFFLETRHPVRQMERIGTSSLGVQRTFFR